MESRLYAEHVELLARETSRVLQQEGYAGLVLFAGQEEHYFADDQAISFRPLPHFARWCPLGSEGHVLYLRVGSTPSLYLHQPESYWTDSGESDVGTAWQECFTLLSQKEMFACLKGDSDLVFIGKQHSWLPTDIAVNPPALLAALDNSRKRKTAYEVHCLTQASEIAARGHECLRACFAAGASEFETHLAYLRETQHDGCDLPYTNIIAGDEKSAILHYQHKRQNLRNFRVMLFDCGAKYRHYCADISRTYVRAGEHAVFTQLLLGLEEIQQNLCRQVRAGVLFYDLNFTAHEEIGTLLRDAGVLKEVSCAEAIEAGLTKLFLPHGVGHMLGVQVHDVGGDGAADVFQKPQLQAFANMRFKGKLAAGEVVTIEPAIYFIPLLLAKHQQDKRLHWQLLQELLPFGGMRIEDNVLVEEAGCVNLTRKFLGNAPVVETTTQG